MYTRNSRCCHVIHSNAWLPKTLLGQANVEARNSRTISFFRHNTHTNNKKDLRQTLEAGAKSACKYTDASPAADYSLLLVCRRVARLQQSDYRWAQILGLSCWALKSQSTGNANCADCVVGPARITAGPLISLLRLRQLFCTLAWTQCWTPCHWNSWLIGKWSRRPIYMCC